MPDPGVLDVLRAQPLFRDLPEARLERLASACRLVQLGPGEGLVELDAPVDDVFVVLEGALLLRRIGTGGRDDAAHVLASGNLFGEATALRGQRWPYAADAAAGGARLLGIEVAAFIELVGSEPSVALVLLRSLSEKLYDVSRRVYELSIASANTRLARYLLGLERSEDRGLVQVELPVHKRDLATLLAITPEHLSRLLRRWSDAGIARSRGRKVTILNMELMVALAEDAQGLRAAD